MLKRGKKKNIKIENFDIRAENLVLTLLHIHGHHYAMKADTGTNPDWDIVDFIANKDTKNQTTFTAKYYQVKAHDFSATSHTISGNFPKLIRENKIDSLFIVIFKNNEEPQVYRFALKELAEKENKKDNLFNDNGQLLFSQQNLSRNDKSRTICLNEFFSKKYKKIRNKHKNKWD